MLKYGSQAFEQKNVSKKELHLEQEARKLKNIIGDLTVELKKANSSYVKRQKSLAVTQRNQVLLEQIKELKRDHLFWGYRRVWSYLK